MELFVMMLWLIVQIPEIAVKSLEPSFDVPVVNVTAISGNLAILPCSVTMLGDHMVAWSDPREKTLTLGDRRVIADDRISIERPYTHDWNLYIRDVAPADSGRYMCQINTNPVKIKYIMLYIHEPPNIIDELSSTDHTAREGDTVQLICNSTGVPTPTVTWYRRSSASKQAAKEVVGLNGEVLVIHNISRYCDDLYECVAFNNIPPAASKEIRVTVEFPPEIYLPTKRIGQTRGKETILECRISSNPKVYSAWKRNGVEISNEKKSKYRVELYEDDKYTITLSLRIMSIDANDFGSYKCVASNSLGSDTEEMILYEYIVPTQYPRTPRPRITYETVTKTWKPNNTPDTGIKLDKNTQAPRKPNREQENNNYHLYTSNNENYSNQGQIGRSSLKNGKNSAGQIKMNVIFILIFISVIRVIR